MQLFALETMRDQYWHNMARRIQRAWRNYWRYKNACATRIQRFWKNNKEGIEYAKVRDYGHQILAGRKERRRFSLLSYRRFMGDYLDVNGGSSLGEELHQACGIGCVSKINTRIKLMLIINQQQKLSRSAGESNYWCRSWLDHQNQVHGSSLWFVNLLLPFLEGVNSSCFCRLIRRFTLSSYLRRMAAVR